MKFFPDEREQFTLVRFELEGSLTPQELEGVVKSAPEVNPQKGVILSGRGPVWLFATLVHHYHPTTWVGCFDPRLGGVVVESHSPTVKVGDVVKV
ncbi:CRISPR-associated protein Csx3 [bacterium]|nr:CRISPR-associated protein Csx3 [bacterium]